MKTVSRVFGGHLLAGLAVFALLLAGTSVVAPTSAKAAGDELTALLIGLGLTAAVVVAVVALDEEDEQPQSP
jgi:hypothetical protein